MYIPTIRRLLSTTAMKVALPLVIGVTSVVPAIAAVVPNSIVTPQTPNVSFAASNGATVVTVFTVSGAGAKCNVMLASNLSAAVPVTLFVQRAATNFQLSTTTVVSMAGAAAGTLPINLFASTAIPLPVDNTGTPYLQLNAGDLVVTSSTSGAGTNINYYLGCSVF